MEYYFKNVDCLKTGVRKAVDFLEKELLVVVICSSNE